MLKLTDGQSENAKIKGQNAKLRNPAFVGMGVLIVALVGISGQIRFLLLLWLKYFQNEVGRLELSRQI